MKIQTFAALSALGATLTVIGTPGCSSAPDVEPRDPLATSSEALYGLGSLAMVWPNGQVAVCFQDPSNNEDLQAEVKTYLANSWTESAFIDFTFYDSCTTGMNEVTVVFSAPGGRSSTSSLGYGRRVVTLSPSQDAAYFHYAVVHEFGHALGFAHEMQRPDNWVGTTWKQCGVAPTDPDYGNYAAAPGGLYLTPTYDSASIMNYCSGTDITSLSAGDVAGVQNVQAYGAPYIHPSPSIFTVTQGGDGVDVNVLFDHPWSQLQGPNAEPEVINVSVSGLPSGVEALLDNAYGTKITFQAFAGGFVGTALATVTGRGYDWQGNLDVHSAQVQITVNACPQTPNTCGQPGGAQCGQISLGCGQVANCGTCPTGDTCTANQCVAPPPCIPKTCTFEFGMCGSQSDGCGGAIHCGSCPSGQACDSDGFCEEVCTTAECACEKKGGTWTGTSCHTCSTAKECCIQGGGYWNGHSCS